MFIIRLLVTLLCMTMSVWYASAAQNNASDDITNAMPPYVRLINDETDITQMSLPDSVFNSIAGRTIFKVNRTELNTQDPFVVDLITRVFPTANEKKLMLVGIDLRGAASPEGPYNNNVRLSIGRAAALREYMTAHLDSVQLSEFNTHTIPEDYQYLQWLLEKAGDPAAVIVQNIIDECGIERPDLIKKKLRAYNWGHLWDRLLGEYFPAVRAARIVLYFRPIHPTTRIETQAPTIDVVADERPMLFFPNFHYTEPEQPLFEIVERRHALSLGTNVLYDGFYMPNFGWAPLLNGTLEFYPRKGNWTYALSFMSPYYLRWDKHKFFQIRDYHFEARRYFNPGFNHTGAYAAAYLNTTIYGIGLSKAKGWEGEGVGGALKVGYVVPVKDSRWRIDFHAAFGVWYTRFDPYIFGNPLNGAEDGRYYYKWFGRAKDFIRRNHQFFWTGPTEIGITISYNILYYRKQKSGASWLRYEPAILK